MDEIKAPYACTCKCVCNNGKENGEREQRKRQVQFSMRLDECYTNIIGQILLMQPLPTVAKAYNMLRQEEKQRDTHKQQVNSPIALNTYKTPFTTSYNPSQRFNTPNLNTPSANSEPERRVGHPLQKYFPPSQRTQGNIRTVNIVIGESSNNVGNVDQGCPWSSPLEPISNDQNDSAGNYMAPHVASILSFSSMAKVPSTLLVSQLLHHTIASVAYTHDKFIFQGHDDCSTHDNLYGGLYILPTTSSSLTTPSSTV
ncbi:hypothetical protein Tco_0534882 [Tanacetum coccineum]